MKKFLIKVNGSQYEVEVEEVGKGSLNIDDINQASSFSSAPVAPTARSAASAPKASAPAKSAEIPKDAQTITAPMPGVILGVNVAAGASVKKGDVLLILEAMKMENEIVSPSDGTIASVNVAKGASVNAGDVLVAIS